RKRKSLIPLVAPREEGKERQEAVHFPLRPPRRPLTSTANHSSPLLFSLLLRVVASAWRRERERQGGGGRPACSTAAS
ncbi:Os02g0639800, partial [Oryza sativa Japonica Group]